MHLPRMLFRLALLCAKFYAQIAPAFSMTCRQISFGPQERVASSNPAFVERTFKANPQAEAILPFVANAAIRNCRFPQAGFHPKFRLRRTEWGYGFWARVDAG